MNTDEFTIVKEEESIKTLTLAAQGHKQSGQTTGTHGTQQLKMQFNKPHCSVPMPRPR
jgi:hypothetical protein